MSQDCIDPQPGQELGACNLPSMCNCASRSARLAFWCTRSCGHSNITLLGTRAHFALCSLGPSHLHSIVTPRNICDYVLCSSPLNPSFFLHGYEVFLGPMPFILLVCWGLQNRKREATPGSTGLVVSWKCPLGWKHSSIGKRFMECKGSMRWESINEWKCVKSLSLLLAALRLNLQC